MHHSGVEILGTEYSFASGAGIFDSIPKEVPNAKFRESIEMGIFDGGSNDVKNIIHDLRSDFSGDSYNLILKNCNHFANALCWALLNKTIPGYVNRLADFGGCCKCLIPKQMLENAPVGGSGSGSDSNTSFSGFQVYSQSRRNQNQKNNTHQQSFSAFTGKGSTLGSSSSTTNSSSSSGFGGTLMNKFKPSSRSASGSTENDLTDRREKARKAALARFESQK